MSDKSTILLVEDDPSILEILSELLRVSGFEVFTATDGLEAVEVFRKHHSSIGVVLSDLGLPRLGGWEAFQRMKAIDPELKALLASGYFDPRLREEALKMGAVDFLQKPYKPADVVSRLSALLSATP